MERKFDRIMEVLNENKLIKNRNEGKKSNNKKKFRQEQKNES